MRHFFHIGYLGYNYRGWQFQPGIPSVQQVLEKTLSHVLKEACTVMGCGRTDAMVHASQYFFHSEIKRTWDFDLKFRLNKALPDDIAIFDIFPVEERQHARFDVTQRTYDYFIHTYKDPFLNQLSACYLLNNPDFDKMKQAFELTTRYDDFHAFCKTPSAYDNTICKVTAARLFVDNNGDKIRFQISANRFLGKMIRMIVGKVLQVGQGVISVDEFEHHLISKQPPPAFQVAYPQGLYLAKVVYPYVELPPRSIFSDRLHQSEGEWVSL